MQREDAPQSTRSPREDAPQSARTPIEGEPPEAAAIYELVVRGEQGARLPLATYRVQFNRDFTFDEARARIDYLHALGISDLYASPFFKARAGSPHGYDLTDHHQLNPEIGSADAFGRLHARLAARGMGLLLDFVPNHMGVATNDNTWWNDVLENGPSSVYAPFFDIDWKPLKGELENKVLLPVLGEHYGRVLEDGQLQLVFEGGAFFIKYWATNFPVNPRTYPMVLDRVVPRLVTAFGDEHDAVLEMQSIITGLTHLPPRTVTQRSKMIERRREKEILKRRLASLVAENPKVAEALEAELKIINGEKGSPRSFDALDALIAEQCYRLGFWRVAAEEINYRRFFDINDLAAIRMENPAVFSEAHKFVFQMLDRGQITGLRIDHPDGLWDPVSYFERLQRVTFLERVERELAGFDGAEAAAIQTALMRRFDREVAAAAAAGPPLAIAEPGPSVGERFVGPPRPLYIVVEKILSRGEELPHDWAVHGTSGYDFTTLVGGVFVDASAERAMTATYERFVGHGFDFATLMYEKKKLILFSSLASELNVLAHALHRLAERDRHTRDFTLGTLTAALREVIACFPVYRTYIRETTSTVAPRDRAAIGVALRLARRRNPSTDASVFEFLRSILLLEAPETMAEADRASRRDFAMRLQQLTGPVMAKGLEDTAFYIYNRLVSLNEVGGEPERFGISVSEFHEENEERLRYYPYSMLATSTHDTKRSEDVRARISVLSEIPEEWERAVFQMAEAASPLEIDLDGQRAPDRNEAYLLYQTLLGSWPTGASAASDEYVERIVAYMQKAIKEAKVNTSWINADPAYDAAMEKFVRGVLRSEAFLEVFLPLARRVAWHGMWGALSQALVKLASPGVPDIYQGNEAWDYSLVDPDNRRKVDYGLRLKMLAEVRARKGEGARYARDLVNRASDGTIKLFVTYTALDARRRTPELFGAESTYTPIAVAGPRRDHVIAFSRGTGRPPESRERGRVDELVVVAPRFSAKLMNGRIEPPVGAVWSETRISVPEGRYVNLFTGEVIATVQAGESAELPLDQVLADFPLALLARG